jgi:hypothetical protein
MAQSFNVEFATAQVRFLTPQLLKGITIYSKPNLLVPTHGFTVHGIGNEFLQFFRSSPYQDKFQIKVKDFNKVYVLSDTGLTILSGQHVL